MRKWKLGRNVCTLHARFILHVLAPIFYARSVLVNKISASELSRKFFKSALLVGYDLLIFGSYFLEEQLPAAAQHLWFSTSAD